MGTSPNNNHEQDRLTSASAEEEIKSVASNNTNLRKRKIIIFSTGSIAGLLLGSILVGIIATMTVYLSHNSNRDTENIFKFNDIFNNSLTPDSPSVLRWSKISYLKTDKNERSYDSSSKTKGITQWKQNKATGECNLVWSPLSSSQVNQTQDNDIVLIHNWIIQKHSIPCGSDYEINFDGTLVLVARNKKSIWRHSFSAEYLLLTIFETFEYSKSSKSLNLKPVFQSDPVYNNTLIGNIGSFGFDSNSVPRLRQTVVQWCSAGNVAAYVAASDNNLYTVDMNGLLSSSHSPEEFMDSDQIQTTQITFNPSNHNKDPYADDEAEIGTMFHGRPDWVYEEEVLQERQAFWWDHFDCNYLSFLSFNDSSVPEYPLPNYQASSSNISPYPSYSKIRYPSPGTMNPAVSAQIFDRNTSSVWTIPITSVIEQYKLNSNIREIRFQKIKEEEQDEDQENEEKQNIKMTRDYLIYGMHWIENRESHSDFHNNKSLALIVLNREQNDKFILSVDVMEENQNRSTDFNNVGLSFANHTDVYPDSSVRVIRRRKAAPNRWIDEGPNNAYFIPETSWFVDIVPLKNEAENKAMALFDAHSGEQVSILSSWGNSTDPKNEGKESSNGDIRRIIHAYHRSSNTLFFTAARPSAIDSSLYAVSFDPMNPNQSHHRITSLSLKNINNLDNNNNNNNHLSSFLDADISPDGTFLILMNQGPHIPTYTLCQMIYSSSSDPNHRISLTPETVLEDNAELKQILSARSNIPSHEHVKIPIHASHRSLTSHESVSNFTLKSKDNDLNALDEFFVHATVFYPSGFSSKSGSKYPVLLAPYGGPGSQEVTRRFPVPGSFTSFVASGLNCIVVVADGRGTGGRGEKWEMSHTIRELGIREAADQASVAEYMAGKPFVDDQRIAIWGWSYGGYTTLMSILGSDIFALGIAVAPVTDWRLYDSVYTERYMGLLNETRYDNSSVLRRITDKSVFGRSNLLVIHGTEDDNVHPVNYFQLVGRLIEQGIQYETYLYPDRDHSIHGHNARPHLYRKLSDTLIRYLNLSVTNEYNK